MKEARTYGSFESKILDSQIILREAELFMDIRKKTEIVFTEQTIHSFVEQKADQHIKNLDQLKIYPGVYREIINSTAALFQ